MKLVILSLILILSTQAKAELSNKLIMGMLANGSSFNQGRIVETGGSLDIAIAGHGWIPLEDKSGKLSFTRYGSFGMDKEGFLSHTPSGNRFVSVSETGEIRAVNIERFATKEFKNQPGRISTANVINFDADGNLQVFYSDGEVKNIAKIYLAVIENQKSLKVSSQNKHVFEQGNDIGEIGFATTGTNSTGKLFPRSLELKDR